MDLQSYYQHARLLQHQAEEAERMEAEKRDEAVKSTWRLVAAKLRELLPVEGMKFIGTFEGQFNQAPSQHMSFDVDCIIRPEYLSVPLGECVIHRSEIEDRKGIIRATVFWNDEANPPSWDVHSWTVRVKGQDERYTAPYIAFIHAYDELQGEIE